MIAYISAWFRIYYTAFTQFVLTVYLQSFRTQYVNEAVWNSK